MLLCAKRSMITNAMLIILALTSLGNIQDGKDEEHDVSTVRSSFTAPHARILGILTTVLCAYVTHRTRSTLS